MIIPPINFKQWIEDNKDSLKPPVCNKVVYEDTEFIIMVVGGPNTRKDYHVDEGEEFFYQLKGKMILRIIQNNKPKDIQINEGEIFLLPSKIPHSPQRFENSVGLVIERKRTKEHKDGLMWFSDTANELLYEEYFHLTNVEKDFLPVFKRFYSDEKLRTCPKTGEVMEVDKRYIDE